MFVNDQKFLKVWKVETQNGIKKLNLGDSAKKKDGTFDNWTWFGCACFGKASEVDVKEGDTITLISGQISQAKYNEKWYTNVKIFDLEVTKRGAEPAPFEEYSSEFESVDDSDFPEDIPF